MSVDAVATRVTGGVDISSDERESMLIRLRLGLPQRLQDLPAYGVLPRRESGRG